MQNEQTKEEVQEHAQLVRALVAMMTRKSWIGSEERSLRIAWMKKAKALLKEMGISHLLRLHEAAQEMQFEEAEAAGFRWEVGCELAKRHRLVEFRKIVLPRLEAPKEG